MNREFVDKMIKAKQMEMDAISCLLPEPVKGHMDVISREFKEMAMDMAKEVAFSCCTGSEKTGGQETEHRTSKVDIE